MSTQPIKKKIVVVEGTEILNRAEQIGRFLVPLEEAVRISPRRFCEVAIRLEFCLKWAWVNCVIMERQESYLPTLRAVAGKSLDLMRSERPPIAEGREAYWRETHDLECFHVAALTGDRQLLVKLAEASTYALDNKTWESSGQAWAGMWKYGILGDISKATAQMELMYNSPRPRNLRLPRRELVEAWLRNDWKQFCRALQRSHAQRWSTYRKYGDLLKETDSIIEARLGVVNGRTIAGWQENSFAVEAWTRGADVPFDPLFFPAASVAELIRKTA